jgi:glycerol-3-phosphate dehydrogenase subunit B
MAAATHTDTIVIGAGLAGLTAAIRLAQEGQRVTLLTKGLGGLPLSPGTVDILGYAIERVKQPFKTLETLIEMNPRHPYATIGDDRVRAGVQFLQGLVPDLLTGDLEKNVFLPTAVGALRPTCLYPPSLAAGDVSQGRPIAIAGPRQLKDFYPELCADNLARTEYAPGKLIQAKGYRFDLPARPGEADSPGLAYARSLDDASYRARFAAAVQAAIGDEAVVGLPAVLGLKDPAAWTDLQTRLGRPVFEVTMIPPSIPGLRLNDALTALAKAAGVRLVIGSKVTGFQADGGRVTAVILHQAGHDQPWAADNFVYAPGGWESGAIHLDSHGHITETLFGLPLRDAGTGDANADLLTGDYWHDQELFTIGVAVDPAMRVTGADDEPVYANLYAAGSLLAGATRWSEKSGEGIALGSAWAAAESILGR